MFDTLEMSLTVLERLASLEPKLRQRRKSLADEVGRAAESIALNVSEAPQRAAWIAPTCVAVRLARQASSPRRCASPGRAATSPRPTSPRSTPRWIAFAQCCGGSPTEHRLGLPGPHRAVVLPGRAPVTATQLQSSSHFTIYINIKIKLEIRYKHRTVGSGVRSIG